MTYPRIRHGVREIVTPDTLPYTFSLRTQCNGTALPYTSEETCYDE
jgi:hypothetical protein